MRTVLAAVSCFTAIALVAAPADGRDLEPGSSTPELTEHGPSDDHDRRSFQGLGLHTHLQIGAAYGQQSLAVERADATSIATGATTDSTATAGGPGMAARMELWPAYGRYGAIGVYGEGGGGAMRREGGGTAMFVGSGGLLLMAGLPQLKVMLSAGRSRRAGAYGSGSETPSDIRQLSTTAIDEDTHYTAGADDVRSHRAGVGVRAAFDSSDRRGLDVWLLFDEPANGGPAFGMPDLSDSAMAFRSALWFRNTLVISGEVTVRGAAIEATDSGATIRERAALVTLGWSMDRFSRPY